MFRPTRNEIDWDTEKKKVRDAVRYNVLSFVLLVAAIRISKLSEERGYKNYTFPCPNQRIRVLFQFAKRF